MLRSLSFVSPSFHPPSPTLHPNDCTALHCRKNVNINNRAVQCNQCNNWIHIKYNGIAPKEYKSLKNEDQNIPWLCLTCIVLQIAEIFPFGIIGNDILPPMNGLDNLCCINSIPNFEAQDRQISKRLLTEDVTKKKRTNPKDVGRKKKENTAFFRNGQVGYL